MTTKNSAVFSNPVQTWNQRFSKDGYVFGTAPNTWLRQHASLLNAGSKVLCIADGEGRNSVWLATQGHHVEAFDISDVGVAKAQRLARENHASVEFSVASCDDFAWQVAHYDAVVAIFIQFADPELRARIFSKIVQSLKPGGTLLLLGYTTKQLEYGTGGPSVLSHLYTSEMLKTAFNGLEIREVQEYETDLAEGDGHKGRSAVIGLVATRNMASGGVQAHST